MTTMRTSLLSTSCIFALSLFVIGSESRDCHGQFMKYLNDSIQRQADNTESAPFSCTDPAVRADSPGTRPEHWDAWQIAVRYLYVNGGPDFPNGILFSPEIGGLPVPTGPAREYFTNGMRDALNQLKQALPDLCTREGAAIGVKILQSHYEEHRDDFKEYAEENCDAIFEGTHSLAGARNLLSTGSKAIIKSIPEMADIIPSLPVRVAVAEMAVNFALDAKGDALI